MASKFERKYGRYAIPNLALYLILGYVIGYFIQWINPEMYSYLSFNPYMIFHGQVWRLVTWVLAPPAEFGIFAIIMLILYYQLGRGLETTWGTYRFNVYLFSGMLFTVAGSLILYGILCLLYHTGILEMSSVISAMYGSGYVDVPSFFGAIIGTCVSTYYINMSIFLAYAFTYPEEQLLLYFIIPVRMKWFGWLYAVLIVVDMVNAFSFHIIYGVIIAVLIVVSLLNFILYMVLGKHCGRFNIKQAKRRKSYRQSMRNATPKTYENGARHKCAICGRTELDNQELTFRYCSKCSGNKEYCQEHLFTHEHK